MYAEPPIAGELGVYELCQLFPLGFAGRGIQDLPQSDCDFPVTRASGVGTHLRWVHWRTTAEPHTTVRATESARARLLSSP
jgi:hypothetical protein